MFSELEREDRIAIRCLQITLIIIAIISAVLAITQQWNALLLFSVSWVSSATPGCVIGFLSYRSTKS